MVFLTWFQVKWANIENYVEFLSKEMPDNKIDDNCLFEVERRLNVYLNSNKLEQLENQHAEKMTVLEAKREEFVADALIYAKSLCEEFGISFEPPKRTIFSSIDRVTAEIREKFQQLQNLAQKYAFLRPEVILAHGRT
ncbi:uncharacterized protein TNCV_690031 [Trichonephila clavipes]|nr:uncharacterized protein TNCV_690031 [Trichonephila clavipes]